MTTFIQPVGVNVPSPEDRTPIWQAFSGDTLICQFYLVVEPNGETPVTPTNSLLTFSVADSQFESTPLWTGTWDNGITEVDGTYHPGLVQVEIPAEVADTLRRGGYRFSIKVEDMYSHISYVAVDGGLLIEYATVSPEHNIPYKSLT